MAEEHEQVVRALLTAANNRDLKGLENAYAPNLAYHGTGDMAETDRSGFLQFAEAMFNAFPDVSVTIDDVFSSGDKVVYRITIKGTHRAELMGIPATNKSMTVRSIGIARVSGGKIIEEWENFDDMGLMMQLDAIHMAH